MLGYESPDEIMGSRAWNSGETQEGQEMSFREELKIKKFVSHYRMKLKKKDGEPIELETSTTIKEDKKGAFLGMEISCGTQQNARNLKTSFSKPRRWRLSDSLQAALHTTQ